MIFVKGYPVLLYLYCYTNIRQRLFMIIASDLGCLCIHTYVHGVVCVAVCVPLWLIPFLADCTSSYFRSVCGLQKTSSTYRSRHAPLNHILSLQQLNTVSLHSIKYMYSLT